MRWGNTKTLATDWLTNTLISEVYGHHHLLAYITDLANWVIKWEGFYITKYLNEFSPIKARATTTHRGIRNQIIHFGSRNLFLSTGAYKEVSRGNSIVFTWFHGTEQDRGTSNLEMIRILPEASQRADIVHTSCNISRENLIRWGVPEKKIALVPLGVDIKTFQPVTEDRKDDIRQEIGIPKDKIVIGSFQKDGVGWGEGLEPKWVKAPDIWVQVIKQLKSDFDIFVLLVGPARGYVKRGLEQIGVPYKHIVLSNYLEIPKYYNALDLYLVASRAEGGPKGVVEAMACGVPLVSTKVGMSPDIIKDGYNGLLSEIDDIGELAEKAGRIIGDSQLAKRLVGNALNTVKDYSWEKIGRQYYSEIYQRFVEGLQ